MKRDIVDAIETDVGEWMARSTGGAGERAHITPQVT